MSLFTGMTSLSLRRDGVGVNASFSILAKLVTDSFDNRFVTDRNTIRKIDSESHVTTITTFNEGTKRRVLLDTFNIDHKKAGSILI
jgi:hypothetical protein